MSEFFQQPEAVQIPSSNSQVKGQSMHPGALVNGVFWHWAQTLNQVTITLRKARNGIQKFITLFVVSIAIFSLVFSILAFVVIAPITFSEIFVFDFWKTPHMGIASFWFFILCLMFLFYRAQDSKSKKQKLQKYKDDLVVEATSIPSLDAVEKKKDLGSVLSEESHISLEEAFLLAKNSGHAQVTALHIFAGTLSSKSVSMLFVRLGITFDQIKDALRRRMTAQPSGTTQFNEVGQEIVAKAFVNTIEHHRAVISPIELFTESYESDEFIQELLFSVGIEKEQMENVVMWMRINEQLRERYLELRKASSFKPTTNMNRSYTAVATPFLDKVSQDLTLAAVYGRLPMLIGRDAELREIMRAIEGGRQSVVLVGQPGVGKVSIIHGIAELMAAEEVPEILQDKRLLRLDVPVIVSSQGGSGAEERLLYALHEVGASGNIVLVIEDIDQLVGASGGGVDLSSVLAGELDKGYTFVLATTTPQGYASSVERSVLAQKLEKINVEEPERNDAIQVLESKIGGIEGKNQVVFTYESVAALIDFSSRYMHDSFLPEKAVRLADEVALSVHKEAAGAQWPRVTKEHVATIVSEKTRIPITQVGQEEGQKLLRLEERMHERMIGQDDAVKAVASALRRARAELRAEGRPIANFLFLGPTGVGKTELAKTTAEVYFGNEESMLRFDMSEYQDKASVYRLIGTTGDGGLLTEAVRKNPFALLLLDELEKAHPDILNLFLQVMDDGRLTDGAGRTIDFTNVILISTSNAGTQYIQDAVARGEDMEVIRTSLMEQELKQVYRPEFLNRFDGVMIFKPLTQEDVVAIAYLMISKVMKRLEAKGITFQASDESVHELARAGYDPKFGARPLRRVIQERVDNAIAEVLLKGEVGRRDTLLLKAGGEIEIQKAAEL
jgi:ATP-dependent Clp protease ATP-binding subunit ClpC